MQRQPQKPMFSWRQLILESTLPPTTRHVLLTLSCHMNSAGESCYPSIATLCRETGLSNRAVCTHLELAKKRGFIRVGPHGFSGQGWKRNQYFVAIPKGSEPRSQPLREGSERHTEGSEPNSRKAVNHVHTSSSLVSKEDSVNKKRNYLAGISTHLANLQAGAKR